MPRWTISLRSDVHLWPAVPTAANSAALVARSGSASSMTISALLPPSSSSDRPRRCATAVPTLSPMLHEPVAEISGTLRSLISVSPISDPEPMIRLKTPSKPEPSMTLEVKAVVAIDANGTFEDGFQITVSPHTAARVEFHAHTATGKLNAEMTPTGPSGCHCSYMRCRGRSEAMVRP